LATALTPLSPIASPVPRRERRG